MGEWRERDQREQREHERGARDAARPAASGGLAALFQRLGQRRTSTSLIMEPDGRTRAVDDRP